MESSKLLACFSLNKLDSRENTRSAAAEEGCRSSEGVKEVKSESMDETEFIGGISSGSKDRWEVTLQVHGKPIKCKIDTGAEATVISDFMHKAIGSPPLKKPDRILRGPSNYKLSTETKTCSQKLYIVKNVHVPLLRCPAIESLEILTRIGTLQTRRFPKLFQGLGKLDGDYHITVKPGATPYSLDTPRRVPIPLMEAVKAELDKIEKQGGDCEGNNINRVVLWHGGCPEEGWSCENLCGSDST